MTPPFVGAEKFGRDLLDGGLRSLAATAWGCDALREEAGRYSWQVVEENAAALAGLAAARTVDRAAELQSAYLRTAYAQFVAEATRMTALYADLARDACKPFEQVVVRAA